MHSKTERAILRIPRHRNGDPMAKSIFNTIVGLAMLCGSLHGGEFKAGVGRTVITPRSPIWMAGFASRTHASEGVIHDLWAKALALEDSDGGRVVIVTTDLIGMPHEITDDVAARLMKKYALDRSQILFNSSHTHCGPVVWPMLQGMFILGQEDQQQALVDYSRQLPESTVQHCRGGSWPIWRRRGFPADTARPPLPSIGGK